MELGPLAGRADDLRLSGFKSLVLWHYGKSLENATELFRGCRPELAGYTSLLMQYIKMA